MNLGEISTKISALTNADTNNYINALRLIDINNGQDEIETAIFRAQDAWKFDDLNQSGSPVLSKDLVANTANYSMISIDAKVVGVNKLMVSYDGVTWYPAKCKDPREMTDTDPTNNYPQSEPIYTIVGDVLTLFPTPKTNVTGGIKITVERLATLFTVANLTTTVASDMKEPGFNRNFHPLIPLYCAIQWGLAKGLANLEALKAEYANKMLQLRDFYANKVAGKRPNLSGKVTNFK